MKEDIVRAVFVKYLQSLGENPLVKKKNVPGPDIIIEGKPYECKGSKFDKDTLFRQLVSNAIQYGSVGIVIPWNVLDCLFIHQLIALEILTGKNPNLDRYIEIHVIAQENNTFFLRRWSSARLLSGEIDRVAYESVSDYVKLAPEERASKTSEFLKDFDTKVRDHIRNMVVKEGRNPSNRWDAFSYSFNQSELNALYTKRNS